MGKAVNNLRLGYVWVRWDAACHLQSLIGDARLQVHNQCREGDMLGRMVNRRTTGEN